ncbi:MAG TPA: class I SAM-dependent methyltransferase [Hyphomicrobiales bacterium]|nr:class I SAM-dependent methyltransferase [Hyphomicrobiales bacterium]
MAAAGEATAGGTGAAFAYDAVRYPSHPFAQTHPGRLATIATLFGMEPAPPGRCRVLELGCGAGGNLLPMAYALPESEFVGIDLSGEAIAAGGARLAALGLTNVTLRHADIMAVDDGFGRFDYIVAHGVYSWVPQPVRDRVLAIACRQLAPQGVAYVSYNAYPGSYLRDLARTMMLHHVAAIADASERVAQGRALMRLLAEASAPDKPYGILLREQAERVARTPDAVLFHDDLDPGARAFFVADFAADAAAAGLQYLGEATFAHTSFGQHGETAARLVERIPAEDFVAREQYLDFLVGRGFRESLLCHAEVRLDRGVGPAAVRRCWIAGMAEVDRGVDPAAEGVATFRFGKGATLATDHRPSKMALLRLAEAWPAAIRFDELAAHALDGLAARGILFADRAEQIEALATTLFRAFCREEVELHVAPPRLVATVGERPCVSLLARREAEAGPLVTTLRHGVVALEDETVRRFLGLVDGTRSAADLAAALAVGASAAATPAVTAEAVAANLRMLARLGLLVG